MGWVLSINFLIIFYFNVCLCALYFIPTQYVYSLLHIFLSNVSELCLFNIAPILKWCKYTYKWSSLISFQKLFSHSFVRVFRERERERDTHTHTHTFLFVVHEDCSASSVCYWSLYLERQRSKRLKASLNK